MRYTAAYAEPALAGTPADNRDDVVDVRTAQHRQLADLITRIAQRPGPRRQHEFRHLSQLLADHHRGEQVVVYPIMCDHTGGGTEIAARDLADGARLVAMAAEVNRRGTEHATFPAGIAALREAMAAHAAYEEHDVFPRLRRRIPVQRLHLMANQLRNVQTMR